MRANKVSPPAPTAPNSCEKKQMSLLLLALTSPWRLVSRTCACSNPIGNAQGSNEFLSWHCLRMCQRSSKEYCHFKYSNCTAHHRNFLMTLMNYYSGIKNGMGVAKATVTCLGHLMSLLNWRYIFYYFTLWFMSTVITSHSLHGVPWEILRSSILELKDKANYSLLWASQFICRLQGAI